MIHGLNGSTLVTLELADYLQNEGAKVEVYTYFFDNPSKHFFDEKEIKVTTTDDMPKYKMTDFDYIWTHSQVLPMSIVDSLTLYEGEEDAPIFIFNHMSPFDWIPDERPYIYDLEERAASVSLFNSIETKEKQREYYTDKVPTLYFPNPAPVNFSKIKKVYNDKLEKVLIVSNHPPQELLEAKRLLGDRGVRVDSFGELSENYSLITPEIISEYDVVITIGKTVQYCLVAGVPVYIYDHFGGGGYLNEDNLEEVASRNFSGRDREIKKEAHQIVQDLIDEYGGSTDFHKRKLKDFIERFCISNVFPAVMGEIERRDIEPFDLRYANTVKSAQEFAKIRFVEGSRHMNSARHADQLKGRVDELEASHKDIVSQLDYERLENMKIKASHKDIVSQLDYERLENMKIKASSSHKIGLFVTYPIRVIRTAIVNLRRK